MMKSIRTLVRQDREKYVIPRRVQDVIPIQKIWEDGIFLTGGRYAKTFRFTDINYQVASEPDKEKMFRGYSAIINSLDCGATTKITIFNHRMSQINFEKSILMPMQWDGLDDYREEYNQMLLDKATNGNGIVQEKFITISVRKKDVDTARSFFARVEADLSSHFAALGSTCGPMNAIERLQILHRFYRSGEENEFRFSLRDSARKGHSFRDYICPDSIERHSDYLQIGNRFARVLYLKDYASYIQDDFVSELTDLNRDMMLSIDMVPIPTDEAVREVENRLLGVETNITNWQRRQNSNNNFSAVVPYDMELQRKESKEFLDDLTTRAQRVCDLTEEKLNCFVDRKLKSGRLDGKGGLAPKTVNDICVIVRSALKLARRKFRYNGEEEIRAPAVKQRRIETFRKWECCRISAEILRKPSVENLAYLLCLETGIRLGEVCALQWSDIDFSSGTVHIQRTAYRINYGGRTELVIQTPKSECSERVIPLTAKMLSLLRPLKTSGYLLTGSDKPMEPRTLQYRFRRFLERQEIPVRNFHILRHSCATRCIEYGMDIKSLSEILGHADVQTTLRMYVHPSMESKRSALELASTLSGIA